MARLPIGATIEPEPMMTMRPPAGPLLHRRDAARARRTVERNVSSKPRSQSSSLISSIPPALGPPALATSTSRRPNFFTVSATAEAQASAVERSAANAWHSARDRLRDRLRRLAQALGMTGDDDGLRSLGGERGGAGAAQALAGAADEGDFSFESEIHGSPYGRGARREQRR